jgi:hypothetical protein
LQSQSRWSCCKLHVTPFKKCGSPADSVTGREVHSAGWGRTQRPFCFWGVRNCPKYVLLAPECGVILGCHELRFAMSIALWAVRILQLLPRSARFGSHLSDCAAHEVLYRKLDSTLPRLRLIDVFRGVKEIGRAQRVLDGYSRGVEPPVHADEACRAISAPTIIYGVEFGKDRLKPVH